LAGNRPALILFSLRNDDFKPGSTDSYSAKDVGLQERISLWVLKIGLIIAIHPAATAAGMVGDIGFRGVSRR